MKPVLVSDEARRKWVIAGTFSGSKEEVYPEHGAVQEFDLHRGKKVLEYGCGGGSDTMSFLRRGNETWFADIVAENIKVAIERIGAAGLGCKAHPVPLEYSAPLPLESDFFDVASSHGVLHHIPDADPVIADIFRVLKPGGVVYVMLYTEELWKKCGAVIAERIATGAARDEFHAFCMSTDYGAPYARKYTEAEGREYLERAGFVVEYAKAWLGGDFRTFKGRKPA